MNCFKLEFNVTDKIQNAVSERNGIKTFEIKYAQPDLTVELYYGFDPQPLCLTATCNIGDGAELVILPHRIELYINGKLWDEEWPAGEMLFRREDKIFGNIPCNILPFEPKEIQLPSVLGEFTDARNWKPEERVFVGDCMPYVNKSRYHVLYLKDRRHHYSKWGRGAHQWAHISTDDFVKWQIHPMAVEITESYEGSICTGSWINNQSTEYLYYTVRMADWSPARICRSISQDGYHFVKDRDFSFYISDKYNQSVARDPKVILDDRGLYHMIITTALSDSGKGCLAHLVSRDLNDWEELPEPILVSNDNTEPECPDYFKFGRYYYLVYSLKGEAHYMLSEKPFSDWKIPKTDIIPCASVPKGAIWNGRIVFTGFEPENGYGGRMIFKLATADENGELIFE